MIEASIIAAQLHRPSPDLRAIEKGAKEFEAIFIAQMLEHMFGESLGDELFGDAETNEVYKGLMMDEYGKVIAESGGVGVADYVTREMLKSQEVPHE